ncbi:MAG TPA: hypothetical protein VLV48_08900 [Thermoanaerobaculia bacterium]|nr:hypothetical protein [Thermoanaerobaculia bacterium]
MWVFDGEQWVREGAPERKAPVTPPEQAWEILVPELQIIEVERTRPEEIPPFPFPLP